MQQLRVLNNFVYADTADFHYQWGRQRRKANREMRSVPVKTFPDAWRFLGKKLGQIAEQLACKRKDPLHCGKKITPIQRKVKYIYPPKRHAP
jgi:hypothetical protein